MVWNSLGKKGALQGALLAAFLAIGVGLLTLPRKYFFHWTIRLDPSLVGLVPALSHEPWGYTFEQLERADLRGQTALVTGANSGIGFEIARALSRQGAAVTMACRNPQRCLAASDRIRKEEGHSGAPISPLILDLSDLKSVQRAAQNYLRNLSKNNQPKLDMLFLNAGIFYDWRAAVNATVNATLPLSKDGIEKTFATNVVGHHLLYRLLEPVLEKSTMARVVSTSSITGIKWLPPYAMSYRFGEKSPIVPATLEELNEVRPSPLTQCALYGRSKLAQMAWSEALAEKLGGDSTIYVNSAHPGGVCTPMIGVKNFRPWLSNFLMVFCYLTEHVWWSPRGGALTELYLGVAVDEIKEKDIRGQYFHPLAVQYDHPHGGDRELQENVWNLCEGLVKDFV